MSSEMPRVSWLRMHFFPRPPAPGAARWASICDRASGRSAAFIESGLSANNIADAVSPPPNWRDTRWLVL